MWEQTAIFITWDEWGGFYDSVMPPAVDEVGLGFRVPLLTISPYTRRGLIDDELGEFSSPAPIHLATTGGSTPSRPGSPTRTTSSTSSTSTLRRGRPRSRPLERRRTAIRSTIRMTTPAGRKGPTRSKSPSSRLRPVPTMPVVPHGGSLRPPGITSASTATQPSGGGDQRIDVHRVELVAEVGRHDGEPGDGARDRVDVRGGRAPHAVEQRPDPEPVDQRPRAACIQRAAARAAGRGGPRPGRRRPPRARAVRTAGRGRCRGRPPRREGPSASRPRAGPRRDAMSS